MRPLPPIETVVMEKIDFAAIRERVPIVDYLRHLGVRLRRSGTLLLGKFHCVVSNTETRSPLILERRDGGVGVSAIDRAI